MAAGVDIGRCGRMAYTLGMRMLSVNRQEFSGIIQDDCIYVDKTEHIHRLIQSGKAFFLARPRRFGKSLLVNTLKELFAGRRELFKDTWIHDRIQWQPHPIIKIDFSGISYRELGLRRAINHALDENAARHGIVLAMKDIHFLTGITALGDQTGTQSSHPLSYNTAGDCRTWPVGCIRYT
jgi:hypothetical protein